MVFAYLIGVPAITIGAGYLLKTLTAPQDETGTSGRGEGQGGYILRKLEPEELSEQEKPEWLRKMRGFDFRGRVEGEKVKKIKQQSIKDLYRGSWQEVLSMTPKNQAEREAQENLKKALSGFYSPEATAYMIDYYRKVKLGEGQERMAKFQEALEKGVGVEGGMVAKVTPEGKRTYLSKFGEVSEAEYKKYTEAEETLRQFKGGKTTEAELKPIAKAKATIEKYKAETKKSAVTINKDVAINKATGQVQRFVPDPAGRVYHGGVAGRWETVQKGIRGATTQQPATVHRIYQVFKGKIYTSAARLAEAKYRASKGMKV